MTFEDRSRWLLILPALALAALGCESKSDSTTEAEATPLTPPVPATAVEVAASGASRAVATEEVFELSPSESALQSAGAAASSAPPSREVSRPSPAGSTAPTPVADDAPRRGPAASGEGFNAWLEGKSRYVVNQPATITVVLTADAPFKCNDQYPYKFTITPPAGVSVGEKVVKSMNVGTHRSTMSIPFTPSAPGTHTLAGELSFSVCTEDKCLIEKQALSIPLDVSGS
jgi:hypothetical protein